MSTKIRAAQSPEGYRIEGVAIVYNLHSELIYEKGRLFREVIASSALKELLQNPIDVRLLLNHNRDNVLARTASGTLTLTNKVDGLYFSADLTPSDIGERVYTSIKRGDVTQMSFGFSTKDEYCDWWVDKTGIDVRYVKKIDRLVELSVVTFPAYPQSQVKTSRSMNVLLDLAVMKARLRELKGF
jgi:uncharacterized protein